jgi:CubicO group peptidase (beta-lactamase class C family)
VSAAPALAGRLRPVSPSAQVSDIVARITAVPKPYTVSGLAMVVQHADGSVERVYTGVDAAGEPITDRTLFPLTSTGKLAVALLVLRLVDAGEVSLDAPIGAHVPGAAEGHRDVTIRRLLSHSGGLPLDLPVGALQYGAPLSYRDLIDAAVRVPLQFEPGSIVQYSNVGYGLLAALVERETGERFWDAVSRHVLRPLDVEAYPSHELPRPGAVIDDVASPYAGTPLEPMNGPYYCSLAVPWTGLFSTADALVAITRAYIDGAGLVSPELIAEARRDQCAGLRGGFNTTDPTFGIDNTKPIVWPRCAWGLGIELRGDKMPHWSPKSAGEASFGHLGSSGCLSWHEPVSGVTWAALGTRTTNNGWLLRFGTQLGAAALAPRGA